MRFIKTFVLHLYLDSDTPTLLCGNLQLLPDSKLSPFKTQAELLGLLDRCVAEEIQLTRQAEKSPVHSGDESDAMKTDPYHLIRKKDL